METRVRAANRAVRGAHRLRSGLLAIVFVAGVLGLIPPPSTSAQPFIGELGANDPVYRQHQTMLAEFHESVRRGDVPPPLIIVAYQPQVDESLIEIAGRLNLPYATLATLNRVERPDQFDASNPILVPSMPALFVFETPRSLLETEIATRLMSRGGAPVSLRLPGQPRAADAVVVAGVDFTQSERALFFRARFTYPLAGARVSSRYGYRYHPFDGSRHFHHGIDFAAQFGTSVVAAAPGIVTAISRDRWLGLMVTIDHGNGYETRYAHVQEALVTVGQRVDNGATIARVGSTGLSTGPHLHFEIRRMGESVDPEQYLE